MDPPDFSFDNLGEILGSLSQEDIDRLSALAGQLMGTGAEEQTQQEPCRNETSGFGIDPDMLFKIMSIMQKLQSRQNDPRCNLITALKPLLSPERQQKADMAIELLRLMSLKDIFGTE